MSETTKQGESREAVPSPAELLERAQELIPRLRERTAEAERLRRMPDATLRDFIAAGFFKILHPALHGGYEYEPDVFLEVVMEVGRGCPSSAWVLGIVGVHNWQLALFDPRAAEDVWSKDSDVLISSSYAPTGNVEPDGDGYRISGRWSFSTGCDHCQWVFLGGVVTSEGGDRDMRTFLLPRSDYRIEDNWHVTGLSGSGSKDIVVEGATVPGYRTHSMLGAFRMENPGAAAFPAATYRYPFGLAFSSALAAPAVGAALGAIDLYRELSVGRVSPLSGTRSIDDPFVQMRIAEACSDVRAGRALLLQDIREIGGYIARGEEIPLELRACTRWDAARVTSTSVGVGEGLMQAAGGHALHLDAPLQRFFRDLHGMRAHALNSPEPSGKNYGGLLMGIPNQEIFV